MSLPLLDNSPSGKYASITTSDSANFEFPCRAIYVGATGDISAVPITESMSGGAGTPVVFKNVPAGTVLPVSAIRVNATLTTASLLVALF